jgi:putative ABC transport system permease protein
MRAIGMNQMQVSRLLYVESIIVAVLGTISGLLLGLILTAIANSIGIPLGLIGQNIYPVIQPKMILISTLVPIIFIVLAAYIPIRAANKLSVVEALNYQ